MHYMLRIYSEAIHLISSMGFLILKTDLSRRNSGFASRSGRDARRTNKKPGPDSRKAKLQTCTPHKSKSLGVCGAEGERTLAERKNVVTSPLHSFMPLAILLRRIAR